MTNKKITNAIAEDSNDDDKDLRFETAGEEPHDVDPVEKPTPARLETTIKVPGITARIPMSKAVHPKAPNFTWAEVTHNGTRQILNYKMTENAIELAKKMQPIRDKLGKITINSWYRDMESNKKAGGATQSMHLVCGAADIVIDSLKDKSGKEQYKAIVKALGYEWDGGVGIYSNRVHLDIGAKRRWQTK